MQEIVANITYLKQGKQRYKLKCTNSNKNLYIEIYKSSWKSRVESCGQTYTGRERKNMKTRDSGKNVNLMNHLINSHENISDAVAVVTVVVAGVTDAATVVTMVIGDVAIEENCSVCGCC